MRAPFAALFDMAGLVEPFADGVNRVTSVALVGDQRKLGHFAFAPAQSPYPFVGMIPQNVTEKILLVALARKSGTVEYATSVVSAVQDDCGVDVTLERAGERSAVRASFVVGCDGAHSTVRHLLDLPFEGAEYRSKEPNTERRTCWPISKRMRRFPPMRCNCAPTRMARLRSFR